MLRTLPLTLFATAMLVAGCVDTRGAVVLEAGHPPEFILELALSNNGTRPLQVWVNISGVSNYSDHWESLPTGSVSKNYTMTKVGNYTLAIQWQVDGQSGTLEQPGYKMTTSESWFIEACPSNLGRVLARAWYYEAPIPVVGPHVYGGLHAQESSDLCVE